MAQVLTSNPHLSGSRYLPRHCRYRQCKAQSPHLLSCFILPHRGRFHPNSSPPATFHLHPQLLTPVQSTKLTSAFLFCGAAATDTSPTTARIMAVMSFRCRCTTVCNAVSSSLSRCSTVMKFFLVVGIALQPLYRPCSNCLVGPVLRHQGRLMEIILSSVLLLQQSHPLRIGVPAAAGDAV